MPTNEEIRTALALPFSASDVEWRLQNVTKDKTRGMAVPFIDSRAIQNRLDEVVGPYNWQTKFTPWHTNGQKSSQLCALSLYDGERKEWITKCDGAENTDIEPIKGGISDSFKRAAVLWGIGRYLYAMDVVWVDAETSGASYRIPDKEKKRLDTVYEASVKRICKTAPPPATPKAAGQEPQAAQKTIPPAIQFDFAVKSAAVKKFSSGKGFVLSLVPAKKGAELTAYLKGDHPDIADGVCLKNVQIAQVPGAVEGSTINILESYEIAA